MGCYWIYALFLWIFIFVVYRYFAADSSGEEDYYEEDYYYEEAASYDFERLESGLEYNSDCITDELGWIEDPEWLGEELEYFYELTGIQPYIYLASYREDLETEDDMLTYAEDWYDANITDEYTFLYFYFSAEDEDEFLYECYVSGAEASEIMNGDTIDVFWDYLDEYWESDLDNDSMFAAIFEDTAYELMN